MSPASRRDQSAKFSPSPLPAGSGSPLSSATRGSVPLLSPPFAFGHSIFLLCFHSITNSLALPKKRCLSKSTSYTHPGGVGTPANLVRGLVRPGKHRFPPVPAFNSLETRQQRKWKALRLLIQARMAHHPAHLPASRRPAESAMMNSGFVALLSISRFS